MNKWLKRRTWKKTIVKKVDSTFKVFLDDKALITPKNNKILLPTRKLALKIVEEWAQQLDEIDPSQMPYTRLVNSAIDKVQQNYEAVVSDLLNYAETDLLCYRTESPPDLVLKQNKLWDPILVWAKDELSIDLKTTCGITYNAQDIGQIQIVAKEINAYDCFTLTGFYDLVTITGSILVAFSLYHKQISPSHAIDISFLDEDWQREKWGHDEESTLNRANKLSDLKIAYEFLKLLS